MPRKICFFTGSRADYGLLKPLMRQFVHDPGYQFQLIVSGSHLNAQLGMTKNEVVQDGFPISAEVPLVSNDASLGGVGAKIADGLTKYLQALIALQPIGIFILGDRYEAFAMCIAALHAHVPILHLHGGEISEGSMDEYYRHCISKMSWLHFASTEQSKQRLLRMGESPQRVFNVGALGVENVLELKMTPKAELEKTLNWKFREKNILFTFHPELNEEKTLENFRQSLQALHELVNDYGVLITAPNDDAQGSRFLETLKSWIKDHPQVCFVPSLGVQFYLSAMNCCEIVMGNSSSGIIEAAALSTWTINIGDRQKNRERPHSVIDVNPMKDEILQAVRSLPATTATSFLSPYGRGGTSNEIKKIIDQWVKPLNLQKAFYDGLEKDLR